MSSGTQVDMDSAVGGANGAAGGTYLTDEEILGIDPPSPKTGFGGVGAPDNAAPVAEDSGRGDGLTQLHDQRVAEQGSENPQTEVRATGGAMPAWMAAAAADPRHGGEARELWREHQEFRAAFASPEEARAVKELLPGGVRDVLSLREATQSVERIDAALFSGDARAQAEVVAELARANPAAFRSLFAEAAKVLAGLGQSAGGVAQEAGGRRQEAGRQEAGRQEAGNFDGTSATRLNAADGVNGGPTLHPNSGQAFRENGEGWGTRNSQSPNFDAAAYATFERGTNDAVARDVRGAIGDTLARVMPEGVADGAARRIGEDIFNEVHRALAADRALSEQVAGVLRDRRFGAAEQQRVASLLSGRAKQLVPSVARRVIGEWTSSVLSTARSKAARQAAAASRVDIAAAGGSLDSMPLRSRGAGSAREVNYAAMSDEEILGI